jgi:hypothetical protein
VPTGSANSNQMPVKMLSRFRKKTALCSHIYPCWKGSLNLNLVDILPPEMIICIGQYLPLSSTVLFTLCCRSAREILGARCWKNLHAEDEQQECMAFLSLLGKDSLGHVPCYQCRIPHLCRICEPGSGRGLTPAPPHRRLTACHKEELLGGVSKYIHKDVTFEIFQNAMKRYRTGSRPQLPFKLLGWRTDDSNTHERLSISVHGTRPNY